MRSASELRFRLRQECSNAWLMLMPPTRIAVEIAAPLTTLPHPLAVATCLKDTPLSTEIARIAGNVLEHRFPLLGLTIETGREIDWRRDYVNGVTSSGEYFRRIPYLDFGRVGDHKTIWELNRHQHLVLLAQASVLTGRDEFFREIEAQIQSWLVQNPFLRGINWVSALEVAFRALSWLWVFHLTGDRMAPDFRSRFLAELYRHGLYLEHNLSVYFSPNTHLLGEAVALHALGALFPVFPRAQKWRSAAGRIVREQMDFQVRPDGSHFEQSSYYHVYALDMFLFHYVLAGGSQDFREKLLGMAEYLRALMGPSGCLPGMGDEDGGRFFHPYGSRAAFGRSTVATCACLLDKPEWIFAAADLYEQAAWWIQLPPASVAPQPISAAPASTFFRGAGIASMQSGEVHVLADTGPFGFAAAGHSHSDTLSLVVRQGAEEILVDSGTFTYVTDLRWRNWFRSSAAHNTIRVDNTDQAIPMTPFRWASPPEVETRVWATTSEHDFLDAVCRYGGFSHRRRFFFLKPRLLFILDDVEGPPGRHLVEQFWHAGLPAEVITRHLYRLSPNVRLLLAEPVSGEIYRGGQNGWRSIAFGQKQEASVIHVSLEVSLPLRLAAVLDFSGVDGPTRLLLEPDIPEILLRLEGRERMFIRYPVTGIPSYGSGSEVLS